MTQQEAEAQIDAQAATLADERPITSAELRASQNIYTIVRHPNNTYHTRLFPYQARILRVGEKQPEWVGEPRKTKALAILDLPSLTWDWASLDTDLFDAEVERRNHV
jgi:hypothetical protein